MRITSVDTRADEILQLFWLQEEVFGEQPLPSDQDQQALQVFKDTATRDFQDRFSVTLPRKKPHHSLGESRNLAVIAQFRCFKISMSANISKMFREVGLAESDRDLHRFLHENSYGQIQDWRMCRVTFGITSSPFLASQVLPQTAEDHKDQYPDAAAIVQKSFYVDDCLTEADDLDVAKQLRSDLNDLLSLSFFNLRKWRSISPELLAALPPDLKEVNNSNLNITPSDCPKTIGIHWNSSTDSLHVCTPTLSNDKAPTKRQLASAVGRMFDIMGWYSPATILIKILLQQV